MMLFDFIYGYKKLLCREDTLQAEGAVLEQKTSLEW